MSKLFITSRKDIHKALIELRNKVNAGVMIRAGGICVNLVSTKVPEAVEIVMHYSKKWPKRSSRPAYPVEFAGSEEYYSYRDKWNHPVHGPRRRELLNFLIRATR